jgi:hypothetical protein
VTTRKCVTIQQSVIDDFDSLLLLAKKGRKRLKKNEIESCHSIDADTVWKMFQTYSIETASTQVPVDVVRMIAKYLPLKEYFRICHRLNSKFLGWIDQDTRVLHLNVSQTWFGKNSCSGTSNDFFTCIENDANDANAKYPITIEMGTPLPKVTRRMCHRERW